MSRKNENAGFTCEQCGRLVLPVSNGSYRNHCPFCLYSKHVDICPGDRRNDCGGLMVPVRLIVHSQKGYQIIHRCRKCGEERLNRIAEYSVQPDDIDELVQISLRFYHPR